MSNGLRGCRSTNGEPRDAASSNASRGDAIPTVITRCEMRRAAADADRDHAVNVARSAARTTGLSMAGLRHGLRSSNVKSPTTANTLAKVTIPWCDKREPAPPTTRRGIRRDATTIAEEKSHGEESLRRREGAPPLRPRMELRGRPFYCQATRFQTTPLAEPECQPGIWSPSRIATPPRCSGDEELDELVDQRERGRESLDRQQPRLAIMPARRDHLLLAARRRRGRSRRSAAAATVVNAFGRARTSGCGGCTAAGRDISTGRIALARDADWPRRCDERPCGPRHLTDSVTDDDGGVEP